MLLFIVQEAVCLRRGRMNGARDAPGEEVVQFSRLRLLLSCPSRAESSVGYVAKTCGQKCYLTGSFVGCQ